MPPLWIQVETREGGGILLTVTGDLDAHHVQSMETRMEEVAASKPGKVVLDLSALSYISSSGALCLLTNSRAMQEEGTRIILVKPPGAIYEIFDLLGMTQLLTFASTLEEAWAALQ
jgi:anti-anti-sigma factor